jgi:hypothetical protein
VVAVTAFGWLLVGGWWLAVLFAVSLCAVGARADRQAAEWDLERENARVALDRMGDEVSRIEFTVGGWRNGQR